MGPNEAQILAVYTPARAQRDSREVEALKQEISQDIDRLATVTIDLPGKSNADDRAAENATPGAFPMRQMPLPGNKYSIAPTRLLYEDQRRTEQKHDDWFIMQRHASATF